MARPKLHPTQEKLLELLKNNSENPLTVRELQEELEVSSTSIVAHHLVQLERSGLLWRNPGNPRDYRVIADGNNEDIAYLNLYGMAQCGPNGRILDGDPEDTIPVSRKLVSAPLSKAFIVRAKGDSMMPKIHEGDLIVAEAGVEPRQNDLVVAVNQEKCIIKKFVRDDNKVILVSLNQNYTPFVADEDFRVEGVVRNVISNLA